MFTRFSIANGRCLLISTSQVASIKAILMTGMSQVLPCDDQLSQSHQRRLWLRFPDIYPAISLNASR